MSHNLPTQLKRAEITKIKEAEKLIVAAIQLSINIDLTDTKEESRHKTALKIGRHLCEALNILLEITTPK